MKNMITFWKCKWTRLVGSRPTRHTYVSWTPFLIIKIDRLFCIRYNQKVIVTFPVFAYKTCPFKKEDMCLNSHWPCVSIFKQNESIFIISNSNLYWFWKLNQFKILNYAVFCVCVTQFTYFINISQLIYLLFDLFRSFIFAH